MSTVRSFGEKAAGDWPQVLTKVEKALAQAVALIQEREQALASTVNLALSKPLLDFKRLEERQEALLGVRQRADQPLAALDTSLREGEEALREWLARAEKLRRQMRQ
jgi:hypothetical protein